jgi:hypothetical protein
MTTNKNKTEKTTAPLSLLENIIKLSKNEAID